MPSTSSIASVTAIGTGHISTPVGSALMPTVPAIGTGQVSTPVGSAIMPTVPTFVLTTTATPTIPTFVVTTAVAPTISTYRSTVPPTVPASVPTTTSVSVTPTAPASLPTTTSPNCSHLRFHVGSPNCSCLSADHHFVLVPLTVPASLPTSTTVSVSPPPQPASVKKLGMPSSVSKSKAQVVSEEQCYGKGNRIVSFTALSQFVSLVKCHNCSCSDLTVTEGVRRGLVTRIL